MISNPDSLTLRLQNLRNRPNHAPNIFIRSLPVANAYPHASLSMPGGSAKEGRTGGNDRGDGFISAAIMICFRRIRARIQETHQALIDRGFPNHFGVWLVANAQYQIACVSAATVNQIRHTFSSELTQRCIRRKAARTPGPFRVPIHLIPSFSRVRDVAGSLRESSPMGLGIRNKGKA